MELKKVSDLPSANNISPDDLIMLVQPNADVLTSTKITVEEFKKYFSVKNTLMDAPQNGYIYGRQNGEWVLIKQSSCDSQIKTIDLTKVYHRRLQFLDYIDRDEIQTYSDMILDYLNMMGVAGYNTDQYYAEYVPDLVDTKIEYSGLDLYWYSFFTLRGFVYDKIRTAYIKDKETNEIVAKVNYMSFDDFDERILKYFQPIFPKIVPVDPTNIDYYINMLNYGLKHGITHIKEGMESVAVESVKPKILNLLGYPFDNKRIQLGLLEEIKQEDSYEVRFTCSIDLPTGCFLCVDFYCNGDQEWVINPDYIR